jgi:hypothetical protein
MPLGAARVVWSKGKRFGAAFTMPLRPDMVDAVIARAPLLHPASPVAPAILTASHKTG